MQGLLAVLQGVGRCAVAPFHRSLGHFQPGGLTGLANQALHAARGLLGNIGALFVDQRQLAGTQRLQLHDKRALELGLMSSYKRFHAAIAGKFGSERHEPHFHIDAVAVELLDLLDFRRRLKDEIGGQAFAEYTGRIGGTCLVFFAFGLIVKLIAGERPTLEMAAAAMRRARCIEAVLGKIVVKFGRKRCRCVVSAIFLHPHDTTLF